MMSYKQMDRRLVDLERAAAAKHQAWLESLSYEELEVLAAEAAERDPVSSAAVDALSEADLERLAAGTMPDAEWQQHLALLCPR